MFVVSSKKGAISRNNSITHDLSASVQISPKENQIIENLDIVVKNGNVSIKNKNGQIQDCENVIVDSDESVNLSLYGLSNLFISVKNKKVIINNA